MWSSCLLGDLKVTLSFDFLCSYLPTSPSNNVFLLSLSPTFPFFLSSYFFVAVKATLNITIVILNIWDYG